MWSLVFEFLLIFYFSLGIAFGVYVEFNKKKFEIKIVVLKVERDK